MMLKKPCHFLPNSELSHSFIAVTLLVLAFCIFGFSVIVLNQWCQVNVSQSHPTRKEKKNHMEPYSYHRLISVV